MEKIEELKLMIEKTLALYNELNPEEKMMLQKQKKTKDISDVVVCVYNNEHVGLFKKKNYSKNDILERIFAPEEWYDSGVIYIGIDSNLIGIKTTHHIDKSLNRYEPIGTKIIFNGYSYIANCNINSVISFDEIRLMMYNEGKIKPYEIGKASSEEFLEVLKYAYNYYQLSQKEKQPKTKK